MKPFTVMLIFLLFLWAIFGCTGQEKKPERREIEINASDGAMISAFYYKNSTKGAGIVLVHMLGKDKSSWDDYVPVLVSRGYDVIAIDLRGHGKSSGDYELFQMAEFRRMPFDVKAGADFLRDNGNSRVYLIGASIGSSAVLKEAASDGAIEKIVLLSPGLDYNWMNIEQDAANYRGKAYLLASKEDEYSQSSLLRLKNLMGYNARAETYEGYGHGTQMLSKTHLMNAIADWLDSG